MNPNPNQIPFNLAYLGLKAQGFQQSWTQGQQLCQYRGDNGLKCAVGHMIPDTRYCPSMEGLGVDDNLIRETLSELYPGIDLDMMVELQRVHDLYPNPTEMKWALCRFADDYNLEIPE